MKYFLRARIVGRGKHNRFSHKFRYKTKAEEGFSGNSVTGIEIPILYFRTLVALH